MNEDDRPDFEFPINPSAETLEDSEPQFRPQKPINPIETIRDFSEKSPLGSPEIAAEYPFTLYIEGTLSKKESDDLLSIVKEEKLGINPEELQIQIQSQRILLPQISEYAGIYLIQKLKTSKTTMRLAPSDTLETQEYRPHSEHPDKRESWINDGHSVADQIPIVSGKPDHQNYEFIDTLTATVTLTSRTAEAKNSTEYQNIVDGLKRELKQKAFRRGASAIISFSISLAPLNTKNYRLMVVGTAIKDRSN